MEQFYPVGSPHFTTHRAFHIRYRMGCLSVTIGYAPKSRFQGKIYISIIKHTENGINFSPIFYTSQLILVIKTVLFLYVYDMFSRHKLFYIQTNILSSTKKINISYRSLRIILFSATHYLTANARSKSSGFRMLASFNYSNKGLLQLHIKTTETNAFYFVVASRRAGQQVSLR